MLPKIDIIRKVQTDSFLTYSADRSLAVLSLRLAMISCRFERLLDQAEKFTRSLANISLPDLRLNGNEVLLFLLSVIKQPMKILASIGTRFRSHELGKFRSINLIRFLLTTNSTYIELTLPTDLLQKCTTLTPRTIRVL